MENWSLTSWTRTQFSPTLSTYLTCHSSAIYTCNITCLPWMLFTCLFLLPHVNYALNYILVQQGRIQGGFEGFVRTPPGWWVILHHHATCGQTSKQIVFPASATSCNLPFCPRLLFPQALSTQHADWCQPGIGPSGWTSYLRGLSAVNRRIQKYRRGGGGGGSLILKLLDHLIHSLV